MDKSSSTQNAQKWSGLLNGLVTSPNYEEKKHQEEKQLQREKYLQQLQRRPIAIRDHLNVDWPNKKQLRWEGLISSHTQMGYSAHYSRKVFLGGIPYDTSEIYLKQSLSEFGKIEVEQPNIRTKCWSTAGRPKQGYIYVVFENELTVENLLDKCTYMFHGGGKYFYPINSMRTRNKDAQVIPWCIHDATYRDPNYPIEAVTNHPYTVFVGALHGMTTAIGLAQIFNDLFGKVIYCTIDMDKYKYPIGSGRVVFAEEHSWRKAIDAQFIDVDCQRFHKKIQIDPYLRIDDAKCVNCSRVHDDESNDKLVFCRDIQCLAYYCQNCWNQHMKYQHVYKLYNKLIYQSTRCS